MASRGSREWISARPAARLITCRIDGGPSDACYGAVTEADFGGSVCVLSVQLLCGAGASPAAQIIWNEPLLIHASGMHSPAPGSTVRITVAGRAHVFSA